MHLSYFPPEEDNTLQLEWRSDKLLMAMRGPLLVLGKLQVISAEFSNSREPLDKDEQNIYRIDGEEPGRFWERLDDDYEEETKADGQHL